MSSSEEKSNKHLDDGPPSWLAELVPQSKFRVHVCFGKNCTPNGASAVFDAFRTELREAGITSEVELIATSCRARCELGPSVNVYPGPVTYGLMDPIRVRRVVAEHLGGDERPVQQLIVTEEQVASAKSKSGRL